MASSAPSSRCPDVPRRRAAFLTPTTTADVLVIFYEYAAGYRCACFHLTYN